MHLESDKKKNCTLAFCSPTYFTSTFLSSLEQDNSAQCMGTSDELVRTQNKTYLIDAMLKLANVNCSKTGIGFFFIQTIIHTSYLTATKGCVRMAQR